MSARDDVADVERVLAGDIAAFEGLVRRWEGPLINLAYRFCRDRGRAEELAQEAFVRAFRGLKGWRKDSAFSTWLFALATNLYRSELRRLAVRTVSFEEILEAKHPFAAESVARDDYRDRIVRRAVQALPAKYRDTVILFYFHEMDVPAAARSLGLPEGTVKARLFRARAILRGKLPRLLGGR